MTKTVTIRDAQTQLSELLTFTLEGNEVIIVEDDKPLARLVPVSPEEELRVEGLNKGTIWTSNDFDVHLPDEFWMGKR